MSTTESYSLQIDPILLSKTIEGTMMGLQMTGVEPVPIGASRCMGSHRRITVIIGCLGEVTGNVTFNVSELAGLYLCGRMLGEERTEMDEEVLDAVGEIGNIIAGSIKDLLIGTDHEFANISCPSVILGAQCDLYYYRGFQTVQVEFEIPEIPVVHMADRFFTVSLSLMRR